MLTGTLFDPEVDRMARLTPPDMAYFADSGPVGAMCESCSHIDPRDETGRRWKGHCKKYTKMTGRCGPNFPRRTPACKYFIGRQS